MLKNYFIIAWRNIQRNKGYTLLNIAGLAFGFAVFIAALLYVNYENSYDRWDKQLSNVYRMGISKKQGDRAGDLSWTSHPLGDQLLSSCPEIQAMTRIVDRNEGLITVGDKQLYTNKIMSGDSAFFTVFPYKFIYGSRASALNHPNQAVISYALSRKIFGNTDPVGKTFTLDAGKTYTITGVFEKSGPSHLDFNVCISLFPKNPNNWGAQFYFTYLKLRPNTTIATLPAKAKSILVNGELSYFSGIFKDDPRIEAPGKNAEQWLQKNAKLTINDVFFEKIADIHLNPKGTAYRDAEANHPLFDFKIGNNVPVMFFSISAILVLLLACINYTNLSIARAGKRAKEAGLRKVMGAGSGQLMKQFMSEAFIQSFIALLVGLLLARWIVYLINMAFGMQLVFINQLLPLQNLQLAGQLLLVVLLVTLFSGAYPAFILSSFQPVKVLKGEITKNVKGKLLRNGLVVLQFSISACFIVGMLVVYKQLHYLNTNDPGFTTDQVLVLKPTNTDLVNLHSPNQKMGLINTLLGNISGVRSVTIADASPGKPSIDEQGAEYNNGRQSKMTFDYIHFNYFKTLNMKMVEGRDFSPAYSNDTVNSAVINQTAALAMGYKDPIGQKVKILNREYNIIGVLKDNHIAGYNARISPEIYAIGTDRGPNLSYSAILVKINGRDAATTVKAITAYWKSLEPAFPLRYTWLDEDFAKLLDKYERFGKMTILLSVVSTIIALMGIFALSAFAAAQRTKEIGIRKVFGASVASITAMLSKDFLILIALSLLVAFPIAYLATYKWLQEFAYRIELSWLIFAFAGFVILTVALITVSTQAVKAAIVNPIKSLRTE